MRGRSMTYIYIYVYTWAKHPKLLGRAAGDFARDDGNLVFGIKLQREETANKKERWGGILKSGVEPMG